MKLRTLALPLVFAAAVLFAYFFTDLGQWSSSLATGIASPAISYEYDNVTLSYTDPIRGYSIRYPTGYPLQSEDGQGVLFFAPGPSGLSESFVFRVANETYSSEELQDIALEELQVTPLSQTERTVQGRRILRLQYLIPEDELGEPLHIVQGLVPCSGYSLYFVASIPETLKDDLNLADYSLYTARCGPESSPA